MNQPVAILHVCRADFHIAKKWLLWARWLSTQAGQDPWDPAPYDLVVLCALSMEARLIKELQMITDGWPGAKVQTCSEYYERPELGYAAMANFGFRSALEHAESNYPDQPILWVESDAIPTRPEWFHEIAAEYAYCHKPVLADFHAPGAIPHCTGNAVYPHNWRDLIPSFAKLPGPRPEQGWDSQCAHETVPISARSRRIQQTWIVPMPRFTEDSMAMLHPDTALFHRCKDGTLIDVLAARMGCPPIPLEAPVCAPTPVQPKNQRVYEVIQPRVRKVGGVGILIVACKRDLDLLNYCLRSIEKYCSGFASIVLMVPVAEVKAFRDVPACVELRPFEEMAGKGFLHHMIQVCRADENLPDADHILHIDADTIFVDPTTPDDYVKNGRCLMVRERYEAIGKRNPNRLIWRTCVQRATGILPEFEGMTRHPNIYPRALYGHVRNVVERHLKVDFNSYVFSCENGFPQSFAEFPTLAAVGIRDMPEAFNFVEYDWAKDKEECAVPQEFQYIYRRGRDKVFEGWSHGGLSRHKMIWDKCQQGNPPAFYIK